MWVSYTVARGINSSIFLSFIVWRLAFRSLQYKYLAFNVQRLVFYFECGTRYHVHEDYVTQQGGTTDQVHEDCAIQQGGTTDQVHEDHATQPGGTTDQVHEDCTTKQGGTTDQVHDDCATQPGDPKTPKPR